MNFNEIVQNTGMFVWVIIALLAIWWIGSVPVFIKNMLEKKGKPVPGILEDHIVIVEIVWIAALLFAAWKLGI